jgi:hypothetical protein
LKVGPLLTFSLSLVPFIQEQYLQDSDGQFYISEEMSFKAFAYQLLELSCGRI